jgi:hypothetical protein
MKGKLENWKVGISIYENFVIGNYFQAILLAFENPASHKVKDGEMVSEVLQVIT